MRNIKKIELLENNQIICQFENGEARILKLYNTIKDKYALKILSDVKVFESAKIGDLGEIYWPGLVEITDLNGKTISCDYDISPAFAYFNSEPI